MALRKFLFQNQTEGFFEEQTPTDELAFGKLTLAGVSGVAINAGNQLVSNVAAPVSAGDAVNKAYADSLATGLDVKQSVRLATDAALPANTAAGSGVGKTLTADANGALTVDGVAVAVGNRVLVKNEAAAANNGIYVVTNAGSAGGPFILTRATDFDVNAEVTDGAFTFVGEGAANVTTGWVLTTNDPITVDTTGLAWAQFSAGGASAYTFEQGLLLNVAAVKIELDTAANAQGAGAGGGTSGLEFDADTAAGKLRVAVSATGGINRASGGLAIEVDPLANTAGNSPTVAVAAAGLSVTRSPKVDENYIANEAIAIGDPVAWSTSSDRLLKGRADLDAKARVFGVARTTAGALNDTVAVVSEGVAVGVMSGMTPGDPIYLQDAGGLGAFASISPGMRVIRMGFAKNSADLYVSVADLGKRAL